LIEEKKKKHPESKVSEFESYDEEELEEEEEESEEEYESEVEMAFS